MVVINSDDFKLMLQVATQETAVARLEISIASSPYSNLDRLDFQRSLMSVHRSSGVHVEIAVTISCAKPPLPRVNPFIPRECVDGFTPSVYYRQRTSPTLASCSKILLCMYRPGNGQLNNPFQAVLSCPQRNTDKSCHVLTVREPCLSAVSPQVRVSRPRTRSGTK